MYFDWYTKNRSDDIQFMSLSRATPVTRFITSQDATAHKQQEEKKKHCLSNFITCAC